MPVASHTLTIPINVTNTLSGAQAITQVEFTMNVDSEADAIAQVLLAFNGPVLNVDTVNTGTVTYT